MSKYFLAFALSYVIALLTFAALGTVSLFRWPVGTPTTAFFLLWTLVPLASALLCGFLSGRRWGTVVGTQSVPATLILCGVTLALVLIAWRVNALQPLTAPGRLFSRLPSRLMSSEPLENLPLSIVGNLLYPALFYLGWRLAR